MTVVTIGISSISFDGHAGDKIVCAAISAISEMVGKYLESKRLASVKEGDGKYVIYNVAEQVRGGSLIMALVGELHDIRDEYPEHITIVYEDL